MANQAGLQVHIAVPFSIAVFKLPLVCATALPLLEQLWAQQFFAEESLATLCVERNSGDREHQYERRGARERNHDDGLVHLCSDREEQNTCGYGSECHNYHGLFCWFSYHF